MKKLSLFLIALFLFTLPFTSCKDDGPDTDGGNSNIIIAQVENGKELDIDSVYAVVIFKADTLIIGGAAFTNGTFGMGLSEIFEDKYFGSMGYLVSMGVSVSDSAARALNGNPEFRAYKDGEFIGKFVIRYNQEDEQKAELTFVDRSITLNGSYTLDGEMHIYNNIKIGKGWNTVYGQYDESENALRWIVNDTERLIWYFEAF